MTNTTYYTIVDAPADRKLFAKQCEAANIDCEFEDRGLREDDVAHLEGAGKEVLKDFLANVYFDLYRDDIREEVQTHMLASLDFMIDEIEN